MSRPPHAPTALTTSRIPRLLVFVLIATLLYGNVRNARAEIAVGASSADFLSFEIGGRSAGMAGAHTGAAGGVTAQFWNPAALALMRQAQVGAMHATWLQDLSYEWLGYARPLGNSGVASLSVSYFHLPGLQAFDEFDNPSGEFKVYDVAVTAGFARTLVPGLSVGANAKLIRQNLATVAATGPAFDVGGEAKLAGTTIGAVAQNLGPGLSYDGASYPLPQQIRFGIGRGFWNDRVLIAADYNIPRDYYRDVRVGTEFRAHPNVSLRMGYRHELGTSNDPATGLSYGLGLHFHQLELDYALTPSNDFDDVHRLSFGYSFGSEPRESQPKKPKPEKAPPAPPAPTGPPVIASAGKSGPATGAGTSPSRPPAPRPSAPGASAPAPSKVAPSSTPSPAAPAQAPAPEPAKPADTPKASDKASKQSAVEYAVILPGYWSKQSAEAELKALELLGFRIKDAQIEKGPESGYQVRLAQMRSKSSADQMASSLARMSFRAVVQLVER